MPDENEPARVAFGPCPGSWNLLNLNQATDALSIYFLMPVAAES
jgi:hypothetical protein